MEKKPWYKSIAIWAGIVTVIVTGYNEAVVQFHLPEIPDFVYAILGLIGVYGRAKATTVLTK